MRLRDVHADQRSLPRIPAHDVDSAAARRDFSALTKAAPRVVMSMKPPQPPIGRGRNPIGQRLSFTTGQVPVRGDWSGAQRQLSGDRRSTPGAGVSLGAILLSAAVLYVHRRGDPRRLPAPSARKCKHWIRNLLLQAESLQVSIRDLLWAQRISAALRPPSGCWRYCFRASASWRNLYSVRQRTREIDPDGAGRHGGGCAEDDRPGGRAAGSVPA